MSYQLRPHQEQAIQQLRESLQAGHKRPILCAPCSAGKTIIACEIIKRAAANGKRCVLYVDRSRILQQALDTFEMMGVHEYSVFMSDDWRYDPSKKITIASIQTAVRRQQLPYDLALVDECHTIYKGMQRLMENYNAIPHIGLTATPYSRGLGLIYDDLILAGGLTTRQLLDKGWLAPCDYYAGSHADVAGLKTKRLASGALDFHPGDLEKRILESGHLAGDIVENYRRHSDGLKKRAITFTQSIAHSKQLCDNFNAAGIKAVHIDGTMDQEERAVIYRAFKAGYYLVCCSSKLLTTGFDDPGVEILIDATPSKSIIRNIQVAGRVWRLSPGKDRGIYLDHAGNIARMGAFPEDCVPDHLDMGEKTYREENTIRKEKNESEPRECPQCTRVFVGGKCVCGYKYVQKKEIVTDEQILQKLQRQKLIEKKEEMKTFLASLQLYAHQKGYQRGWIYHTFKKAFKDVPYTDNWPAPATTVDPAVKNYIKYLNIRRAKSGANIATS